MIKIYFYKYITKLHQCLYKNYLEIKENFVLQATKIKDNIMKT